MRPSSQNEIVSVNECGCIVDYSVLEKALIWFSDGVLKSNRKIYIHANYPCVTSYYKKIHVHRLIAMYLWPNEVSRSTVVHHKDENVLNSSIDNLEVMSRAKHGRHHNIGKKFSEDHKRKIAEASSKRTGMIMKRKYCISKNDLVLHLGNGLSISKIAKIYGCDWSVIKSRINEYSI